MFRALGQSMQLGRRLLGQDDRKSVQLGGWLPSPTLCHSSCLPAPLISWKEQCILATFNLLIMFLMCIFCKSIRLFIYYFRHFYHIISATLKQIVFVKELAQYSTARKTVKKCCYKQAATSISSDV